MLLNGLFDVLWRIRGVLCRSCKLPYRLLRAASVLIFDQPNIRFRLESHCGRHLELIELDEFPNPDAHHRIYATVLMTCCF